MNKKKLYPKEYIVLRYHGGYQDLGYFFVLGNIHIQGRVFAARAAGAGRTASAAGAAGGARDAGATGYYRHYRHQASLAALATITLPWIIHSPNGSFESR